MTGHSGNKIETSKKPQTPKKVYSAPRLTPHGDVRQITETLGGAATDGQLGSQILDN